MGIVTDQLELRKNTNTQSIFNSLHCSYNKKLNTTKMPNNKSYKLNTTIMPNNKSYKLNTTIMPNNKSYKLNTTIMPNDNEKRDYNTGVSDGIKKF